MVSVHDVTPAHEQALRRILAILAERGVGRASLLVVPDHHGAWDLRAHPRFAEWLRRLGEQGHEVVLHGLEHREPAPPPGPPWRRLLRRLETTEGEFATLGYQEARARLARGLEILASIGFGPQGFAAPGWMQNGDVVRAVRDAGLRYFTSLRGLTDLERGVTLRARPVCFSSRSAIRAVVTTAYCAVLSRWNEAEPVLRIAVHPGDLTRNVILSRLLAILGRARATRRFVAYRDLLERAP